MQNTKTPEAEMVSGVFEYIEIIQIISLRTGEHDVRL